MVLINGHLEKKAKVKNKFGTMAKLVDATDLRSVD